MLYMAGLTAACAVAGLALVASRAGPGAAGGAVLAVVPAAVVTVVQWFRRSFTAGEEGVWRYLTAGAAITAVSALSGYLITALSPSGDHVGGLVAAAGALAAAPMFYQGLIHWNRVKTARADPDDRLNGLSGVLVAAAIGNAALPESMLPRAGLVAVQHQAALCALAGGVVLTGTAITLCFLSGLRSDRRLWLLGLAMATLSGPPAIVLAGAGGEDHATVALSAAAAGATALAAALPRPPIRTVYASAQATTRGSLVVMFLGVGVLVVHGGMEDLSEQMVTVYAGLGVLMVGARLLGLVRDLEQLSTTREQALTDDLTGIGNRRALTTTVTRRLEEGQPSTLLLFDLDDFKEVNDRHGHGTGDDVLREVAELLSNLVPTRAVICRLGGDEFAVMLPAPLTPGALTLARQLVDASTRVLDPAGRPLRITASVGVASLDRPAGGSPLPATELLRRADVAMYRAKVDRSGVAVYDPELDARARDEQQLLQDLYDTLEVPGSGPETGIEAWFQPQIDAATHAVVGAEALVRWNHGVHGVLAPDRWLPLAERHGLINEITPRMLRQATEQWRWAIAHGYPIRMSVNLSASCLTEPELLVQLDDLVAEGLDPTALVLEITETALMTDPEEALDQLWAIRERGFEISIDDYGTGFSSLSYLRDLPATELKIDRSFVERLAGDERTRQIVSATAELAHGLGMRLIGEGVEDEETLDVLSALGCDETQGYLHGRPMPAAAFQAWLLRQTSAPPRPPAPRTPPSGRSPASARAAASGSAPGSPSTPSRSSAVGA